MVNDRCCFPKPYMLRSNIRGSSFLTINNIDSYYTSFSSFFNYNYYSFISFEGVQECI
jgi:hypothetical protein